MKKQLFASMLAGALGVGLSTEAAAQDFGGFRIEARGGYQTVNLEAEFEDDDEDLAGDESEGGVSYGAEIGFDVQASSAFAIGAYAGYALSNVERCEEVFGNDEGCLEAGRTITVGLRAGLPVSANALLYGKAGYSNTRLKVRYEGLGGLLGDFETSESGGGWHAGGGAEFGLGGNLYAKAEYVFTNSSGAFEEDDATASLSADRHEFVAGLGLRF
jgi:outer membrane immunogenic protein